MALPEIATPIYTLTIPSTKKKVKYRPFLVKEQKVVDIGIRERRSRANIRRYYKYYTNCLITKVEWQLSFV